MLIGKIYRRLFKRKILISTLYLESNELFVQSNAKVQVFGNFTRLQWGEKLDCKYDPKFKCFKCDKVRIMIGHIFKFIVNDKHYIISNRYPFLKDTSDNSNNVYDPRRIKKSLPNYKNKIPHVLAYNPMSFGQENFSEVKQNKNLNFFDMFPDDEVTKPILKSEAK